MDQELKAKWLTALRSSEYRQARGDYYVEESNGYCCLGVLACVDQGITGYPYHAGRSERKIANGKDTQRGLAAQLMNMNDSGKSFPEIADWIEANL